MEVNSVWHLRSTIGVYCLTLIASSSCSNGTREPFDHPRFSSKVVMRDVSFHSAALNREITYRVMLPVSFTPRETLPSVYLLHGAGGDFRDWSKYSDVGRYAEVGLVLIMPEGGYSYYMNAAERPEDRYEDYIVQDLISDVEARFPITQNRTNRAIVGVSMGGFGAIKIALSHP